MLIFIFFVCWNNSKSKENAETVHEIFEATFK